MGTKTAFIPESYLLKPETEYATIRDLLLEEERHFISYPEPTHIFVDVLDYAKDSDAASRSIELVHGTSSLLGRFHPYQDISADLATNIDILSYAATRHDAMLIAFRTKPTKDMGIRRLETITDKSNNEDFPIIFNATDTTTYLPENSDIPHLNICYGGRLIRQVVKAKGETIRWR